MGKKRLSEEETGKLLKLWRSEHNKEALEMLVLSNMGLVKFFAKKYLSSNISFEDLTSIGTEGLIKAINKFNLNKSISFFSVYISVVIDNQIKMELRREKKHSKVISFNGPIGYNKEGDEMAIEDIVGTDEEQLYNDVVLKIKVDIVREALKKLTYREQQIILLRYGLTDNCQKTQEEIAEVFGCSKNTVYKQEQKALIKMRHPRNIKKIKDFLED